MFDEEPRTFKIFIRHFLVRFIKAFWFLASIGPLSLAWFWLANAPSALDLYVARDSLPHGSLMGFIWVSLNIFICLSGAVIALIPALFCVYWVWKLEQTIVLKWFSKRTRQFLDLTDYKPPLDYWIWQGKEK